jgi:hypothetical protein
MRLVPIPWARRVWGLPFLAALAPSERWAREHRRRHKKLTDWGCQVRLQVARWLPERRLIAVADTTYAAIDLLKAVRDRLTLTTRLRLDARLFDPPLPRRGGRRGRPRCRGARQPTLVERVVDPKTPWVSGWYGQTERCLDIVSGTALWDHHGRRVPIRWVLVRDIHGDFKPQMFVCTDVEADPLDILRWFVRRWSMEVTFAEVRRHLGVETQRQWTDLAIARTTPALLGLFSLITLWAHEIVTAEPVFPRRAAWYRKTDVTFSNALGAVRQKLWVEYIFWISRNSRDVSKPQTDLLKPLIELACFTA